MPVGMNQFIEASIFLKRKEIAPYLRSMPLLEVISKTFRLCGAVPHFAAIGLKFFIT
jgi:hypothetical protein